jgi:hypothetical protein
MFLPQFGQKSLCQSRTSPQEHIIFVFTVFRGFSGLSHTSQNFSPLLFLCPQTQIIRVLSLLSLVPHSMQKSDVASLIVEHVHNIDGFEDGP